MQCVVVSGSVLQCVAVSGSVLQCVVVSGSVLQCVSVSGRVLQCVAVHLLEPESVYMRIFPQFLSRMRISFIYTNMHRHTHTHTLTHVHAHHQLLLRTPPVTFKWTQDNMLHRTASFLPHIAAQATVAVWQHIGCQPCPSIVNTLQHTTQHTATHCNTGYSSCTATN